MPDLPDYYTQVIGIEAEAYSFRHGADANKPADPDSGDIWLATDTLILYVCVTDGVWTGFDASILVQGTLTLYENMDANSKRITSLADPTAAQDAATRAYVDAQETATSISEPTRALDTVYRNTSGKARVVCISLLLDDNEEASLLMGAASPPTTRVGFIGNSLAAQDMNACITGIVPDDYYYEVESTTGTPVKIEWIEYDLEVT